MDCTPIIRIVVIDDSHYIWLEFNYDIVNNKKEPEPRYVPVRQSDGTFSRQEILIRGFSTIYHLTSDTEAQIFSAGLSKAFDDAEIVEATELEFSLLPETIEICKP